MHSKIVYLVLIILVLPFSVALSNGFRDDLVIFCPEYIGEEPFIVKLNVAALSSETRVRIALTNGENKVCSRIWNGSGWIKSDASWNKMPRAGEGMIYLQFWQYSGCSGIDDVKNLKIRFRANDTNTEWIERKVKAINVDGKKAGEPGGIVEGYLEENNRPIENCEIEVCRSNKIFRIYYSEPNGVDDHPGKGYFKFTLPVGTYTLKYRNKRITFQIRPRERTYINFEPKRVFINEVRFKGSEEWIELINREGKEVNLENWYITDRDNFNITLSEKISDLCVVDLYDEGSRAKLTDTGDDVLLVDNFGRVVDWVGWGNSRLVDEPPEGYQIFRDFSCRESESLVIFDGEPEAGYPTRNLDNDLTISRIFHYSDAEVFLSPENSFDFVMSALDHAKRRVYLNVYKFNSLPVFEKLKELGRKGVEVKLLLGQESPIDLSQLDYKISKIVVNHAKYAIIDDSVIIGSENWDENGLPVKDGNRGWWILIESRDIELLKLFALDWNNALGEPILSFSPSSHQMKKWTEKEGKLLISPLNSFEEIYDHIDSAKSSIYMEQLYIKSGEIIEALERAASRGVKVTIVLDDRSNLEVKGAEVILREKVHNKGMIIDERWVLISSINLCDKSFFENREIGVIIEDAEIAKYFYENRIK